MGALSDACLRMRSAIFIAIVFVVFGNTTFGSAEELKVPDPLAQASARLKNLSSFVDTRLQTVKSVNKGATAKIARGKDRPMDVSAFSQLAGRGPTANIRTLESTLRFQQLDSVPRKQAGKPYDFWSFDLDDERGFCRPKLDWMATFRSLDIAVDDDRDPKRAFWFSPKQFLYGPRIARLIDPGSYGSRL